MALTIARSAASGAPPASTIHNATGAATTEKRVRFASSLMRGAQRAASDFPDAARRATSDLHDLGLFGLDHLVDLRDVVVVDLLEVLLRVLHVVLAHAIQLLQRIARVGASVPDGDLPVFGELVDDLHELLATLLVHLRQ